MRITFVWLVSYCFLAAILSSCTMFGAGSHVYCETVTVHCPSDSIIQQLTKLKGTGRFEDARSFPDGPGGDTGAFHDFFFYDAEQQVLVRLEVPLHTPKNTEIHLAGIKDFRSGTEWIGFANVPAEKKKVVGAWFDQVARPVLACEHLSNP